MQRPLEVLVLENRRGGGHVAARELEAAGHHVHHCHVPNEPAFPCRGVVDPSDCPLEGPVDVALVVREHIHTQPSAFESGVSCAIRAGVPVVEDGSSILDPFEPWITARVGGGEVAATCEEAVATSYAPLVDDIRRRCAPLLATLGLAASDLTCDIELVWPKLQVHLQVPRPVSEGVREGLAVRALDAVRFSRRTYSTVNVQVHEVHVGEASDMGSG